MPGSLKLAVYRKCRGGRRGVVREALPDLLLHISTWIHETEGRVAIAISTETRQNYNAHVNVCAPWLDVNEAKHEYDAIVVAAEYEEFRKLDPGTRAHGNPGGGAA